MHEPRGQEETKLRASPLPCWAESSSPNHSLKVLPGNAMAVSIASQPEFWRARFNQNTIINYCSRCMMIRRPGSGAHPRNNVTGTSSKLQGKNPEKISMDQNDGSPMSPMVEGTPNLLLPLMIPVSVGGFVHLSCAHNGSPDGVHRRCKRHPGFQI